MNDRRSFSSTQSLAACRCRHGRHWPALAVAALLGLGASITAQAQRQATAIATVDSGFVVGITVTDGGAGYSATPQVTVLGGGGAGATAKAVLLDGAVSEITVLSAGRGYTSVPTVVIEPPALFVRGGVLSVLRIHGAAGLTNEVQYLDLFGGVSAWQPLTNLVLTTGSAFLVDPTEALLPKRFYRALQSPVRVATATAVGRLAGGFLVAITVTDGGAGYTAAPTVRIAGGGGALAAAVATVTDGVVTQITVSDAGAGYTSLPTIAVAPPPTRPAPRLVIAALATLNPNPDPANLVWIWPGTFTMGSPASEQDRREDEVQTVVTLTHGFFLGQHEVTQGEYQAVTGRNPSYNEHTLTRPVEAVSWEEAAAYCGNLTARERAAGRLPPGWLYRLPTEAEWEYAARAGTSTRFSWGDDPGSTELVNYAWLSAMTSVVGQKWPNPWGLYDMAGNVWEWCADWYGPYPGGSVADPTGPATGSYRVMRGGAFRSPRPLCRSALRYYATPGGRDGSVGFRVALAPGRP